MHVCIALSVVMLSQRWQPFGRHLDQFTTVCPFPIGRFQVSSSKIAFSGCHGASNRILTEGLRGNPLQAHPDGCVLVLP